MVRRLPPMGREACITLILWRGLARPGPPRAKRICEPERFSKKFPRRNNGKGKPLHQLFGRTRGLPLRVCRVVLPKPPVKARWRVAGVPTTLSIFRRNGSTEVALGSGPPRPPP